MDQVMKEEEPPKDEDAVGDLSALSLYVPRTLSYVSYRVDPQLPGSVSCSGFGAGGAEKTVLARCDPNCGVEKWDVNGEERCAIFALRDIAIGEELTFDYKFESFSKAVSSTVLHVFRARSNHFAGLNRKLRSVYAARPIAGR
ncbi:unnamed protein product [Phytophthora fragariaefolia]|uniref:Unnamed protein product n=1 Tax=Phytophthora fragariaefolia TaxID=1490495 RepID=A0A9W6WTQ6_9STRA|nr:unnamed protein product [Phytophthora fragariaefolia]